MDETQELPIWSREITHLAVRSLTTAEGATFTPWTDGYSVGYKVSAPGVPETIIYFNPSTDNDEEGEEGVPAAMRTNVFVYRGTGDPYRDEALHWYLVF